MTGGLGLDTRDFETLMSAGSGHLAEGRHKEAADALAEALDLWRGDPYADVRSEGWAQPEIGRLEQVRLDAVEGLATALLELGRHTDVLARLDSFVRENPLRERAWELLALAHYRAGRQAAALDCLRRAREVLAAELGIDPGPRLRELEGAVLRQDSTLLPPERPATASPPRRPPVPTPKQTTARGAPEPAADPPLFVGRESALEFLHEAAKASSAVGQVVLVDGEPGVGKTSLLRRFRATADVPVGWGSSPDHEANTDRYVRESLAKTGAGFAGMPWFLVKRLGWYFARIWVEVTPERIVWWPEGDLSRTPEVWTAPGDVVVPASDPAPKGPRLPSRSAPPADWRPFADRAGRLGEPVVTTVADGMPLAVRTRSAVRNEAGFDLRLPVGVQAAEGPVCLTFHRHGPAMEWQENVVLVGTATGESDRLSVRVERALNGASPGTAVSGTVPSWARAKC